MTETDPTLRHDPELDSPAVDLDAHRSLGRTAAALDAYQGDRLIPVLKEPLSAGEIDTMKNIGGLLLPEDTEELATPYVSFDELDSRSQSYLRSALPQLTDEEIEQLHVMSHTSPRSMLYFLQYVYDVNAEGTDKTVFIQHAQNRVQRLRLLLHGLNQREIAAAIGNRTSNSFSAFFKDVGTTLVRVEKEVENESLLRQTYEHTLALYSGSITDAPDFSVHAKQLKREARARAVGGSIQPSSAAWAHKNARSNGLKGALWNQPETNEVTAEIWAEDILPLLAPDFQHLDTIKGHFQYSPTAAADPDALAEFLEIARPQAEALLADEKAGLSIVQKPLIRQLFEIPGVGNKAMLLSLSELIEKYKSHGGEEKLHDLAEKWLQMLTRDKS